MYYFCDPTCRSTFPPHNKPSLFWNLPTLSWSFCRLTYTLSFPIVYFSLRQDSKCTVPVWTLGTKELNSHHHGLIVKYLETWESGLRNKGERRSSYMPLRRMTTRVFRLWLSGGEDDHPVPSIMLRFHTHAIHNFIDLNLKQQGPRLISRSACTEQ